MKAKSLVIPIINSSKFNMEFSEHKTPIKNFDPQKSCSTNGTEANTNETKISVTLVIQIINSLQSLIKNFQNIKHLSKISIHKNQPTLKEQKDMVVKYDEK